jgi:hypothetical protein
MIIHQTNINKVNSRDKGILSPTLYKSNSGFGGPVTRFPGIYSGRLNAQSDLGIVWKGTAVKALTDSVTFGHQYLFASENANSKPLQQ